MKTLYIDCQMGAAGDMLTAALTELFEDKEAVIKKLNSLSIPDIIFSINSDVKCGITGSRITVKVNGVEETETMHEHHHEHEHHHGHEHHHEHEHTHHHSSMHDIEHIIEHIDIPEKVKKDILAVYGLIAKAESHAHGVPVTDIHFHEVGTMDAIADITAVCLLINELCPDEIIVSPVHVGCGQVKCAHGILPVPAPATAYILKDVPVYGGSIKGELCTPTGAALLKHFASKFSDMPLMKISKIGYGMGSKDFEAANCVRVFYGESGDDTETVSELSCNVDDMTAEEIGFACEKLLESGALEVFTVPVCMKKSRPGTLIKVLCKEADKEKTIRLIFRHTSTIGIRETKTYRYILNRKTEIVKTPYGDVRRKSSCGYGVKKSKYEYEDIAAIAKRQDISFDSAKKLIEK